MAYNDTIIDTTDERDKVFSARMGVISTTVDKLLNGPNPVNPNGKTLYLLLTHCEERAKGRPRASVHANVDDLRDLLIMIRDAEKRIASLVEEVHGHA